MKYGIYLPNFGAFSDARALADIAAEAEAAGWDGCFIWDHLVRSIVAPVVDPWIAMAAMAMTTHTIQLGALVTPLARRRPWKVARETVSLDHLCAGRLVLGVGLGGSSGQTVEWLNFGEEADLAVRAAKMDESLEIITGLWSGRPFRYSGKYFQVGESIFLPPPLQSPRIPIWVAGNWPHKAPFRRAARWDGAVPLVTPQNGETALDLLRQVIAFVAQQRGSLEGYEMVFGAAPTPGEDKSAAANQVAPFAAAGVTWWNEQIYPIHFGCDWNESSWPQDKMLRRIRQGPPR